ncbi:PAS domain-containing protein [Sphingomonas sp. LHG3406-1]|uniref:sensor histidine kinase n=1 Tax=Sphingomonas sp. LHG3406-1 TaxID=2804617 RepID=UPI0026279603|nr:PAS domain-containing protein [Sphingomonas sp. LHG3406-1]
MSSADHASQRLAALETEIEQLLGEPLRGTAEGGVLKLLLADISRRLAVEGQLRQAQEWLHLAQETGRVAAYTFDFATGKLEWSSSTMALYGFQPGVEPTIERWLAAIHPEDRAAVQAVADAALQRHAEVDHRFRILASDGQVNWIQDRGRVILDDQGRPLRLVGINIDVTELVELEHRASETGARLRLALAAGHNACWDWDLTTGKVTWDEELGKLTRIKDFGGNFESFWALVHEEDKPVVSAALERSLATGDDYRAEFRMVRPDRSVRWTFTQARVVQDEAGRPVRLVGIDSDITDQKTAQAELHESRRFLESVLSASPDCVKVVERNGSVSYMNSNGQRAMEIADFGLVAGRQWVDLWPSESRSLIEQAIDTALSGQQTRFEAECPTALGTLKWWDVSVAPIVGGNGQVERIVAISRDVSDRRCAEEQLKTLNAELHHRVKNNLATVQALARSTLRSSSDPKTFERAFSGRIEALGKTYDILRDGSEGASLGELVESELKPFGGASDRIGMSGSDVNLSPTASVAVGMILHELATNASKYGAFAHADGRLDVRWDEVDGTTTLEWVEDVPSPLGRTESGGGFGSVLIDRLARQIGGTVIRRWEERGLAFELVFKPAGPPSR